jgi:hypothetical protein
VTITHSDVERRKLCPPAVVEAAFGRNVAESLLSLLKKAAAAELSAGLSIVTVIVVGAVRSDDTPIRG